MKQTYSFIITLLLICCTQSVFSQRWKIKEGADFPGKHRTYAVVFVINDIAYVGTGNGNNDLGTTDFYKYDPDLGKWSMIADFPGGARQNAVAFTLNGKGYVGLGYRRWPSVSYKDFYEYTPETDTWKQIQDFPGTAHYSAVAFTSGNAGYVGTGEDGNSQTSDFYKYENGNWSIIAPYPYKTSHLTSFKSGNYTYIGGGERLQ